MVVKSPFKSILLVVETADSDIRASDIALEMASNLETPLVGVAVIEIDTLKQLLRSRVLIQEEMDELARQLETAGQRQMDYIASQANARKVTFEPVIARGALSSAILDEQQKRGSDLVIMGGFTYTMLKRDINLRQKQLIIDQCPCSILLVK